MEATSAPGLIAPAEVMRLDTDVYNLAYHPATDSLWFAQMRGVDPDYLYRVDAATGESTRWQLPETLHNGFLTEVEVAEDGGVWISYEYRLLRFDPTTEIVGRHDFPIVQPLADQVGGTWISGIGTEGDKVWVVLNGLSEVAMIDSQLREIRRVRLPDVWRNSRDVGSAGGLLFVVRGGTDDLQGGVIPAGVGVFSQAGEELAFAAIQTQRLMAIEGRVLAFPDDGQGGQTAWVEGDGKLDAIDTGSFDYAATAIGPDVVVIYSHSWSEDPARIARFEGMSGSLIAAFEQRWVPSDFCHQPPTLGSAPAMPSCPPVLVGAPEIGAIAASPTGAVWYFENFSGRASILWKLPPVGQ